jgi:hypothetical protein
MTGKAAQIGSDHAYGNYLGNAGLGLSGGQTVFAGLEQVQDVVGLHGRHVELVLVVQVLDGDSGHVDVDGHRGRSLFRSRSHCRLEVVGLLGYDRVERERLG